MSTGALFFCVFFACMLYPLAYAVFSCARLVLKGAIIARKAFLP